MGSSVAVRRRPAQGAPGRHFLRSSRLASDFVREAGVAPGDLVVDIGAGAGALTRALADARAEVLALELAPDLARELRLRFDANRSVTVIEVDALDWVWPARPSRSSRTCRLRAPVRSWPTCSAIPAGRSRRADVIVQWDFAAQARSRLAGDAEEHLLAGLVRRDDHRPPCPDGLLTATERRCRGSALRPPRNSLSSRLATPSGTGTSSRTPFVLSSRSGELCVDASRLQVKRLAPTLGFAPDARARDLDARQWAALYAWTKTARGGSSQGFAGTMANRNDGRRPPQYRCQACPASSASARARRPKSRSSPRAASRLSSPPTASPGSTSTLPTRRPRPSSPSASAGIRSTSRTSSRSASGRRSTSTRTTCSRCSTSRSTTRPSSG